MRDRIIDEKPNIRILLTILVIAIMDSLPIMTGNSVVRVAGIGQQTGLGHKIKWRGGGNRNNSTSIPFPWYWKPLIIIGNKYNGVVVAH